jgi:hypothetical protein
MAEIKALQLELWEVLQTANDDPIAAEFDSVWKALEDLLPELPLSAQIETVSNAIEQVTDIFQVQAESIFEALDATATMNGPTMASDAFDRYVRQSMEIDFEDYMEPFEIEPSERSPRGARSSEHEFYSQAKPIDKTILLEALHEEIGLTDMEVQESVLSIAHGENVTEWIATLRCFVLEKPIEFQQLLACVDLALVELWLGLLLGGYELRRSANLSSNSSAEAEDFYSFVGLLIQK